MSRRIMDLENQLSLIGDDRDSNTKELLASRGILSVLAIPYFFVTFVLFCFVLFASKLVCADFTVQLAKSKDTIVRELAQARQINDRQGMELEQQASKI